MHLGWRLFWGVVGFGIAATVLTVTEVPLAPPVLLGLAVAFGVVVAIGGPMLLELLALAS